MEGSRSEAPGGRDLEATRSSKFQEKAPSKAARLSFGFLFTAPSGVRAVTSRTEGQGPSEPLLGQGWILPRHPNREDSPLHPASAAPAGGLPTQPGLPGQLKVVAFPTKISFQVKGGEWSSP